MSHRITIPDDKIAVVMSKEEAADLLSLARIIRGSRKVLLVERPHRDVASSLILNLVDAGV